MTSSWGTPWRQRAVAYLSPLKGQALLADLDQGRRARAVEGENRRKLDVSVRVLVRIAHLRLVTPQDVPAGDEHVRRDVVHHPFREGGGAECRVPDHYHWPQPGSVAVAHDPEAVRDAGADEVADAGTGVVDGLLVRRSGGPERGPVGAGAAVVRMEHDIASRGQDLSRLRSFSARLRVMR